MVLIPQVATQSWAFALWQFEKGCPITSLLCTQAAGLGVRNPCPQAPARAPLPLKQEDGVWEEGSGDLGSKFHQ